MSDPITTIASVAQFAAWRARVGLPATMIGEADALAEATAELQGYCGRQFLPSPTDPTATETRTFSGDNGRTLFIDDCLTIASVTIEGTEVASTLYDGWGAPIERLELKTGTLLNYPYSFGGVGYAPRAYGVWLRGASVIVTGRFGYAEQSAFPANLVTACCILAATSNLSGFWDSIGIKRMTVIHVTVELDGADPETRRQAAFGLAAPYRRLF
jgi:hypothetical protein